ncbi:MAG: hypothetical protein Q9175_000629 [Cornicularia normoerica]
MHLLIPLVRNYATASTRSSRLPSSKPPLSLDHFLLRQRVLSLYRTTVRACHKIPPPTREEMKKYAREEFEQHKAVEDLRKIRYLLSTGKAEFERLGKQSSVPERNQQISIMGTIYKQAQHVYVYLGWAEGNNAQAVEPTKKLQQRGAFIAEKPE